MKNKNHVSGVFFCLAVIFAIGGFLFFAPCAHAAIIHNSTTSATTGAALQNTLSWSHNAGGTDRILIVGIAINGNIPVSSVSYAGLPLTRLTAADVGGNARTSLWYRLNPLIGTSNVTVTMQSNARFVAGAQSYTGVSQTNPFGTPVARNGSGTAASLTVLSSLNEVVVDVLARRGDLTSNPITPASGQTLRWNQRTTLNNNNSGVTGGGSNKPGQSSTVLGWTWPTTRAWAVAAVSLKPQLPPPDITPPVRFNGLPSGTLPAGTSQTTLSLETDEPATCKYGTIGNTSYGAMGNTFNITAGTSHLETVSGLTDGTSYTYYIRCVDSSNNFNNNDFIINFSVDATPPPPPDTEAPTVPGNFTAMAVTAEQINLAWDPSSDNAGVAGYQVFRDSILVNTVVSTSYVGTGLTAETTYLYEVLAFDSAGNFSARSSAGATTLPPPPVPDTEPPTIPAGLEALAVSASQIDLAWQASSDNEGVSGYNIFRDGALIAGAGGTTLSDQGLSASTAYLYALSAYDSAGNESSLSATVSATTHASPPPPDSDPPLRFSGLPSGLLPAQTTETTLSLQTDETAICRYEAVVGVSFASMINSFSSTGNTGHETQLTFLQPDTDYQYYIRCQDLAGNRNDDDYEVSFAISALVDEEPPTVPDNLSLLSFTQSAVLFDWFASVDNVGVTGYKVFRDGEQIASTPETTYTDSGLIANTQYSYTISAYDSAGNESAQSAPLAVTTQASDTTAPDISAVTASQIMATSSVISWSTDEPATSLVEYGLTPNYGQQSAIQLDLKTEHSVALPGLSGGTSYHYRVRSADESGNEAVSIDHVFTSIFAPDTTPPAAVTALRTSFIGLTSIDLAWTAPGDDEDDGVAATYDLRFSASFIDDANWGNLPLSAGLPLPGVAGDSQNYIVVGLTPGTQYYFALKTSDEAGNVSLLSNIVQATTAALNSGSFSTNGGRSYDRVPPAMPAQVKALSAENQIILQWLNPSDADFVRVVIVRKEGSAPATINDGLIVYEGNDEEFIDINVLVGVDYYYAIFAYDRAPNYSAPANVNARTQAGVTSIPIKHDDINLTDYFGDTKPEVNEQFPEIQVPESAQPNEKGLFNFTQTLDYGMRNEGVRELQKLLARSKIIYPEGLVTGYFGNLTRPAVRRFQCAFGIICSGSEQASGYGRVGLRTISLLNSPGITQKIEMFQRGFFQNLAYGSRHMDVEYLQRLLKADSSVYPEGLVTGYYGVLTQRAVQRFQCDRNIVCAGTPQSTGYGFVGPRTRAALNQIIDQSF